MVLAAGLAGCTSGTQHPASATQPASETRPTSGEPAPNEPAPSSAAGISVATSDGFKFVVAAAAPVQAVTTITFAGQTLDATPGTEFVVASLDVRNPLDQQEPLDSLAVTEPNLENPTASNVVFGIPRFDATAFGGPSDGFNGACIQTRDYGDGGSLQTNLPPGWCAFDTLVASVSPGGQISPVQVPPGVHETVMVFTGGGLTQEQKASIPTSAPLKDMKVFILGKTPQAVP